MSLHINDLVEYERKLDEIITHAEKEREAIRLLIKGIRMRGLVITPSPAEAVSSTNGVRIPQISQGVVDQIDLLGNHWFTVRIITKILVQLGVGKGKSEQKLRPIVANYLKKHFDNNKVERRNIGSDASPIYEYRKYEKTRML